MCFLHRIVLIQPISLINADAAFIRGQVHIAPDCRLIFLRMEVLLRAGKVINPSFAAGGQGGIIERMNWNGQMTWSYVISSSNGNQHHDIRMLPNGNVLAIVNELITEEEATAAGRNPLLFGTALWSEKIVEIQPQGLNGGTVVWQWRVWDHLVQQFDNTQGNYGVIADHPELINVNYNTSPPVADWLHCNGIDYNEALDQIMISSHGLDEFWIIDHSSTTEEAATHSGGNSGHGGDLLYRWGNPETYGRGVAADKKLFGQHHAQWINDGYPDEGKIILFNNGFQRPEGNYSSVDIIDSPLDENGNYSIAPGEAYLPDAAYWSYTAPIPTDFYGMNISGAQRLWNGHTLICTGPSGDFFEIDTNNVVVWRYISPVTMEGSILSQGSQPAQNAVFRCTLYAPDYEGFIGQVLSPGPPIEINPSQISCDIISDVNELSGMDNVTISAHSKGNQLSIFTNETYYNANIVLLDATGRILQQWISLNIASNHPLSLDVNSNVRSGIYFLLLNDASKQSVVKFISG